LRESEQFIQTRTGEWLLPKPQVGPVLHVDVDTLPRDVVKKMLAAVGAGEKDRLDELIRAVADQGLPGAPGLRQLADNYDYDALTSLLSSVST
jgi:hypothetical protein